MTAADSARPAYSTTQWLSRQPVVASEKKATPRQSPGTGAAAAEVNVMSESALP